MEMPERSPKRPVGWSKPYWARTGLYAASTLVSFLFSLLVVRFGCGMVLRAAIPAAPITWRVIDTVLDLLVTVAVAWYFASREGYDKRTANTKTCVGGGLLFLLIQSPAALVFPPAAGPLASTLAQLIFFGNQSTYAASLESPPPLLIVGCMVIADVFVLIPAMVLGERIGALAYEKEKAALIEEGNKNEEEHP